MEKVCDCKLKYIWLLELILALTYTYIWYLPPNSEFERYWTGKWWGACTKFEPLD